MRTRLAAALSLMLVAGSVLADTTPWISMPGPINSRGLYGAATNVVVSTVPMPAAPDSGGWWYLTISGNLTRVAPATLSEEACIEISGPGFNGQGGKVIVKPFSDGSFTGTVAVPAGAATMLPETLANAGQLCTLRFFELYADNASGADATWSNLTISLGAYPYAGAPMPFSSAITPTPDEPDVDYGNVWLWKDAPTSDTFTFGHDRVVGRVRWKGFGTAMTGWTTNSALSPLYQAEFHITAPKADGSGNLTWSFRPFAGYAASSSSFDYTFDLPAPVLTGPSHPWSWTMDEENSPVAAGPLTKIAAVWFNVQPLTPDAPDATDLGAIRGKPLQGPAESTVVRNASFTEASGQVKWYTFTTEADCNAASGYWLDIHSQIPGGSTVLDHEMAVYDASGHRLANDDDGGSDHRSMLTFGAGTPVRPPVMATGSPKPRNGGDGALPAGQHYLAVTTYNASFADTGWFVTTTGTASGAVAVEFRTNLPPLPCGTADVGGQGGAHGADGQLDNNDFVVYIDMFFAHDPAADLGSQGGLPGADGQWNNNDFVVFINEFFAGCQ
jgi:hypothetical protein